MTLAELFDDIPVLETSRLRLSRTEPEELGTLFGPDPGDPALLFLQQLRSFDEIRISMEMAVELYSYHQLLPWRIDLKDRNESIGACAFTLWSIPNSRAEIGLALNDAPRDRDYLPEILEAMLTFGFGTIKLNRIEARPLPEDTITIEALEQAGLQLEASLRAAIFLDGSFRDQRLYGMLRIDDLRFTIDD